MSNLNIFCFGFGQVAKTFIQKLKLENFNINLSTTSRKKTHTLKFNNINYTSFQFEGDDYDIELIKNLEKSDYILVSIPPREGTDLVIKNFSNMKFKCISKILPDINYGMFIKFNRFFGFEITMQSYEKFKNFKQYKFIVDKKKILKDVYFEALERNSESTIFSYFSELKILRKKIDIDLRLMYQEFKILIIKRIYKFFFRKDISLRYYRIFKNSDKLNIKTVLKNIEK